MAVMKKYKNVTASTFDIIRLGFYGYLSDKFPNNHVYLYDEEVDIKQLFKVWNLDNCLAKLELIST